MLVNNPTIQNIDVTVDSPIEQAIGTAEASPPSGIVQVGGYTLEGHFRAVEVDRGNGLNSIDSAHHEQHEGFAFAFFEEPTTLSANGTRDILVLVGVGGIHF